MSNWVWLFTLCSLAVMAESLPANLLQEAKKADQTIRPKPIKRAQEMLMFGNQQNRQSDSSNSASSFASVAEKRTLGASGLGGLKAALAEDDKPSHSKTPSNSLYDRDDFSTYDKNYEYDKVHANDLEDQMRQVWDAPPYARYYLNDDRRKKSEKSTSTVGSTTLRPSTTSFQSPTPTQQSVQAQVKRSIPIYQEPRFKRDLDIDPEDVLTLLSLWENERRNRNWHKYLNEEYENVDDDANMLDEDDPRNVIPWMDSPVYPPRHYGVDSLSQSDTIGIVRTHQPGYYKQYGNQFDQQYDGVSQYGLVYPQPAYYNTPEKRFMVTRKRSQVFDPFPTATVPFGFPRRYPYERHPVY